MLEFGDRKDFDNPRHEWRRLFSELLGTFFLVLVAAGGGILHGEGQISLPAAVVAPGLMVMAIILFMGAISGAHLNPAVSWPSPCAETSPGSGCPATSSSSWSGRPWPACSCWPCSGTSSTSGRRCPAQVCQLAGAADGDSSHRGLVSVILGTASAAQNVGAIAALGVGGYIALAGLWAAPVSGVSMNPARSFGPALVSGDFTQLLGLRRRPASGGGDRSRLRLRPARARRRPDLTRCRFGRADAREPGGEGPALLGHRCRPRHAARDLRQR